MCLGGKTQEGLVHCKTHQKFDLFFSKLCVKWDKDEAEKCKRKGDRQEPKYFMRNKAYNVYHHCRSPALCEVGIDDEFFDNDPESINALIKIWESREKNDISKFASDMKLHDKQRHDILRAFCGTAGLYTVKEENAEFAAGAEF